jgi:dTDP-4-amino-4,6-dideoxygalactose transaminase
VTGGGERPVPFVDVAGQTARLHDELLAAIDSVVRSGVFVGGPEVEAFEREFGERLGLPPGVGCSSGTSALSVLLEAAGVGPGDEVVTTAHTFIASAAAIVHVGASPVFAEIDPRSYTIDPASVDAAIGPRTRAVLPVHLYGTPCDMAALNVVAARHGIVVLEDAAQAHGATLHGQPAGALGDGSAFSFYPGKNLGAMGDAGLLAARDPAWLERARRLVDHGRDSKYVHGAIGYNHRLDAIQAAILRVKLRHLDGWTAHRRSIAATYDAALGRAGFKVIVEPEGARSSYHLYVVEVGNRDEVLAHLQGSGIGCGIHYPVPVHLQPAFEHLGHRRGMLPRTEWAADHVVSLPIDGEISATDAERVLDAFLAVAIPAGETS